MTRELNWCVLLHEKEITFKTRSQLLLGGLKKNSLNQLTPNIFSLSQWLRSLTRAHATVRLLELWVQIPPGAWMSVSCVCYVSSSRGLCVGLITRTESSTDCGVFEGGCKASIMGRLWPIKGCCATEKRYIPHIQESKRRQSQIIKKKSRA
jgi:hypothetical protein